MKPRDIFLLAIRLLGLLFLYHGLATVPSVVQIILANASTVGSLINAILLIAWDLLVAWWLIGGAPLLMRHAYPGTAIPVTE
jgi:hypothetical protein